MIEIHSHLLPGVDDGAAGLPEALDMIRAYIRQGVSDVICTPHFSFRKYQDRAAVELFVEACQHALADLSRQADERGLPIKLHLGFEFALSADLLPSLAAYGAEFPLSLAGSSYILLEMTARQMEDPGNLDRLIYGLQMTGLTPILAHPERTLANSGRQSINTLAGWVRQERILIQVNASSIVDLDRLVDLPIQANYRRRQLTRQLLDLGLVHFVASDAHDCQLRPPLQARALQVISKRLGKAVADRLLFDHAKCLLQGQPILFY